MPCVVDILKFIVSYVNSISEGVHTDLNEFGLELMNVALNAGGPGTPPLPFHDQLNQSDYFGRFTITYQPHSGYSQLHPSHPTGVICKHH